MQTIEFLKNDYYSYCDIMTSNFMAKLIQLRQICNRILFYFINNQIQNIRIETNEIKVTNDVSKFDLCKSGKYCFNFN